MKVKLGQLLKVERLRQNMKQEVLADGICSASYLSKIENNLAVPSEQVLEMLFARLNIPSVPYQPEGRLNELLDKFKKIIDRRDRAAANLLLKETNKLSTDTTVNNIDLLLIQTRLLLFNDQHSPTVEKKIILFNSVVNEMSSRQKFHFYLIDGIRAYADNQFRFSLDLFNKAEKQMRKFEVEDWEMADLHYVLSLASLSDFRDLTAIEYAQKALAYFNSKMLLSRSIRCSIIIGLAKKRIGNFDEAILTFKEAMDLFSNSGASFHKETIEHNLGICYSLINNNKLAMQYFISAFEGKKHANDKIVTAIAILKEYYKMENFQEAKVWLENCLSLLPEVTANRSYYKHHLIVYEALLRGSDDFYQSFRDALDYLSGLKNYYHCFIYCHLLSKKLAENHEYKKANEYHDKSFNYYLKHKNMAHWGDLF